MLDFITNPLKIVPSRAYVSHMSDAYTVADLLSL